MNALGGFAPSLVHRELGAGAALANGIVLFAWYCWILDLASRSERPAHVSSTQASLLAPAVLARDCRLRLAWSLVRRWARRRPLVLLGTPARSWCRASGPLHTRPREKGVFAERYLYLPVFGFGLLSGAVRHHGRATCRPDGGHLARSRRCVCSRDTVRRPSAGNRVWRDNLSLWTDAVAKSPDSAAAHEYLGFAPVFGGSTGRGDRELPEGTRPGPEPGRFPLEPGCGVRALGRQDEAIAAYEWALRLRPNSAESRTSLGLALVNVGQVDRGLVGIADGARPEPCPARRAQQPWRRAHPPGSDRRGRASVREAAALDPAEPRFRDNLARARTLAGAPGQTP